MKKYLLIPDCHVPFHDVPAFSLMLRAAKTAGVKNAVLLGDFLDCFSVSSHPKLPTARQDLAEEIESGNRCLDLLDRTFTGDRIYIEGNHEFRLQRYLTDNAPALFTSLSLPRLLRLGDRGWRFVRYRDHVKIGRLFLTHDVGKAGRNAYRDAMAAFQGNVVIGHTHRFGLEVEGSARGKTHIGASFGWLGSFDALDYAHKIRAKRDWVHGFGIAYLEPGGNVHLTACPIVEGRVMVEGKLVS